MACVPVSVSVSSRSCGKLLVPRDAPGRPKCSSSSGVSGRSIVVPSRLTSRRPRNQKGRRGGPRQTRLGKWLRDAREQFLQRRSPEPDARPRDRRLAGKSNIRPAQLQPAHAFQQAAQDLAIRGLGIQCQGHDIVDHEPRRQLALPLALATGGGEHGIDQLARHRRRQHAQRHVVADPRATRQRCGNSGHRHFLRMPSLEAEPSAQKGLSQRYCV